MLCCRMQARCKPFRSLWVSDRPIGETFSIEMELIPDLNSHRFAGFPGRFANSQRLLLGNRSVELLAPCCPATSASPPMSSRQRSSWGLSVGLLAQETIDRPAFLPGRHLGPNSLQVSRHAQLLVVTIHREYKLKRSHCPRPDTHYR